jgi:putative aminopeptidase FrvX
MTLSTPCSSRPWVTTLEKLIAIDSPTGFTHRALEFIEHHLTSLGLPCSRTPKGTLVATYGTNPHIACAAHVDTLGAMVSHIRTDGTLGVARVGSLLFPSVEGEYCTIYTSDGRTFSGTLLLNNPSAHVNRHAHSMVRDSETMHIRIDASVYDVLTVRSLGIEVGDYVAFSPRFSFFPESGFIKSRFLDSKAGCVILLELARSLTNSSPSVEFHFTSYEEVGHGAAALLSPSIHELLIVDMAVVGEHRNGSEYACSVCALDSSGPYDYDLRTTLVRLAAQHNIPCVTDVYPFYTSDGSAAMIGGNSVKVGLLGPGIAASHGVERTHVRSVEATMDLLSAHIRSKSS